MFLCVFVCIRKSGVRSAFAEEYCAESREKEVDSNYHMAKPESDAVCKASTHQSVVCKSADVLQI